MNAILKAQNAYRDPTQPIRTARDTEYNIMAQITHRLKVAAGRGKEGFPDLAGAIHDNRRLWTILATDVAAANNSLPKDLRARILYLAEYTRTHSKQVLNRNTTVDALVDINTAIMRGLRDGGMTK